MKGLRGHLDTQGVGFLDSVRACSALLRQPRQLDLGPPVTFLCLSLLSTLHLLLTRLQTKTKTYLPLGAPQLPSLTQKPFLGNLGDST